MDLGHDRIYEVQISLLQLSKISVTPKFDSWSEKHKGTKY